MRCVAMPAVQEPPPAGATELATELRRRGLAAQPVVFADGRCVVRVAAPGMTSGTEIRCLRRGVSWCYASEYDVQFATAEKVADYVRWLFGISAPAPTHVGAVPA